MLRTRSPVYSPLRAFSLDLHVLGTPPAFVLSQDQTLQLSIGVSFLAQLHRTPWLNGARRCTQSIASSAILLRGLAIQFSETDQARPSHSALPTTSPSRRVQHPGEGRASYRCQRCASRVLLPLFPLPSEPARATRSSGAALSSNAGCRCQLRVGHPVRLNPGLMIYHFSPRERARSPSSGGRAFRVRGQVAPASPLLLRGIPPAQRSAGACPELSKRKIGDAGSPWRTPFE